MQTDNWLKERLNLVGGVAIQQDANKVSCQVTVDAGVTGIDVSSASSRNCNGDLTLGSLSRTFFLGVWKRRSRGIRPTLATDLQHHGAQGVCDLFFHQRTVRTMVWMNLAE